ncbi:hypothetical protein HRbin36_01866 [bacterium HR36]|nr:hypothetical protein HRbin36_01866 [bacterium HR36]
MSKLVVSYQLIPHLAHTKHFLTLEPNKPIVGTNDKDALVFLIVDIGLGDQNPSFIPVTGLRSVVAHDTRNFAVLLNTDTDMVTVLWERPIGIPKSNLLLAFARHLIAARTLGVSR